MKTVMTICRKVWVILLHTMKVKVNIYMSVYIIHSSPLWHVKSIIINIISHMTTDGTAAN